MNAGHEGRAAEPSHPLPVCHPPKTSMCSAMKLLEPWALGGVRNCGGFVTQAGLIALVAIDEQLNHFSLAYLARD